MKPILFLFSFLFSFSFSFSQDTLWVRYDNRFQPSTSVLISQADSLELKTSQLIVYTPAGKKAHSVVAGKCDLLFSNPGRYLLKPSSYSSTDYENTAAKTGYNFAHSQESDHFAVFWDVRYGSDPTHIQYPGDGNVTSAKYVLDIAERCWDMYAKELGFIHEGSSTTDKYKIQLYIPYQTEWRADASGQDGQEANGTWGKTGIGHFNPWAAAARGGHTIAHEVGHTFQYLVSADLGDNHGYKWGFNGDGGGDCGWWESCADWQAYQIFPERQFTDGEYFEQHLASHHLNLLHEDWRYACCYIQDWWCMKYGRDFIGRLWRAANRAEDPVQTYKRMNGNMPQEQFNDEMMEGYMRMATWDIDRVRDLAKHRIGQHRTFLKTVDAANAIYQADSAHCIQNYGYAIINLRRPVAGTVVRASFTGLTDASGYHYVNKSRAGWRYAFVAMQTDGTRIYGEVKSDKEGIAELTVPASCSHLFFVVMGAPTVHWSHPWDRGHSAPFSQNNEQWPYRVQFENTKPLLLN